MDMLQMMRGNFPRIVDREIVPENFHCFAVV